METALGQIDTLELHGLDCQKSSRYIQGGNVVPAICSGYIYSWSSKEIGNDQELI